MAGDLPDMLRQTYISRHIYLQSMMRVEGERWLQCQTGIISHIKLYSTFRRLSEFQILLRVVKQALVWLKTQPHPWSCLVSLPLSCESKRYLTIVTRNITVILRHDIASPGPAVSPALLGVVCAFLSVQAACSCRPARRLLERRGGRKCCLINCGR